MPLVVEEPMQNFDLSLIKRGDLLYGRHATWDEGKAGFVTSATKEQLIVQYHPGIGNVTNHFIIPVSEAARGEWEIRWSSDMSEVHRYPADVDEELPEENEGNEESTEESEVNEEPPKESEESKESLEGGEDDEAGGTDLQ